MGQPLRIEFYRLPKGKEWWSETILKEKGYHPITCPDGGRHVWQENVCSRCSLERM